VVPEGESEYFVFDEFDNLLTRFGVQGHRINFGDQAMRYFTNLYSGFIFFHAGNQGKIHDFYQFLVQAQCPFLLFRTDHGGL